MNCQTCGEEAHDFKNEEILECIPPPNVLIFGAFEIDEDYRNALFSKFPFLPAIEIVGSFKGMNPDFPSQSEWLEQRDEEE